MYWWAQHTSFVSESIMKLHVCIRFYEKTVLAYNIFISGSRQDFFVKVFVQLFMMPPPNSVRCYKIRHALSCLLCFVSPITTWHQTLKKYGQAGKDKTSQTRTRHNQTKRHRSWQNKNETKSMTAHNTSKHNKRRRHRTGRHGSIHQMPEQGKTGPDKTGLCRTGQDRTGQYTTDITEQDGTWTDQLAQLNSREQCNTARHSTVQHNTLQVNSVGYCRGLDGTSEARKEKKKMTQDGWGQDGWLSSLDDFFERKEK